MEKNRQSEIADQCARNPPLKKERIHTGKNIQMANLLCQRICLLSPSVS